MKKNLLLSALLVTTMLLPACGDAETAPGQVGDTFELTFASQDAEGLPSTDAMHRIADEVALRTDGNVTMKIYPSNQLGEAKLLYEGVMDGSVDMYLGYLDPTYDIAFDLTTIPFLASSYDQIGYICSPDSNCYQIFDEHCANTDMYFLGFFLNGVNGLFSTEPLGDYLDIDSKKTALIRIANSVTYSLGVEALGYPTITIPWSDTYTSMQTGVMDGMVGIPSYMVDQNFGDLTKYYVAMDMFMEANTLMMSPQTAENLPAEYLAIIEEVCAEVCADSIAVTEANVNKGIEDLAARGIEILPITDEERTAIGQQVLAKIEPELKEYFGDDMITKVYEDIANASAS